MKRISAKHPIRNTPWVWPEAYMYLYNHYAQFRRDFELSQVPDDAPFFITADKAYRLYVNGRYVCRGPARGYQSHWPCDEVDLAPFLREGCNWVAIEGYNPGISNFQYLHQNFAGLLCVPGRGKLADAWARSQWQMRRDPARESQTARLSLQLDFQEHMDLSRDDRSWITAADAPKAWCASLFPADTYSERLSFPFGMPPFDEVEERGIPLLREGEFLTPAGISSHGIGRNGEGYRFGKNVAWPFIREVEAQCIAWDDGTDLISRKSRDTLEIVIDPAGDAMFRAITIFNGEYVLGCLDVEVDGALGSEILDFYHYQFLRDGEPKFVKPGAGSCIALANRLRLRAGSNHHEFFHPLASAHFTIIARDLQEPLTVRLRVRRTEYPFTMRGGFECSDGVLNEIHAACRRTQQLCAMDAYVDTPWREQVQWWGDVRVQARNTFFLDGDSRLLARGIESIAGQPLRSGLTLAHAPTSGTWCAVISDFSITWIITIWDYYYQTGDIALFKRMLPRIRQVLSYFDSKPARTLHGLLRSDPSVRLFADWSTLPKGPVSTFLNLWYCLGLRKLAQLYKALGQEKEFRKLEEKAATQESLVVRYLFDEESGLFHPSLDVAMKPAGDPSVHDQTLALMLGLRPEAHQAMLNKTLLPFLRGEEITGARASAFWSSLVVEEMGKLGHGEECLAFIRRNWSPMLSTGTTWENFQWDETSGNSACHAWSAHPCSHLVNLLAGIKQGDVAWSKIEVRPFYAQGIDRVEARVPSPKGDIVVKWHRQDDSIKGTVKAPEGVEVTLTVGEAQFARV